MSEYISRNKFVHKITQKSRIYIEILFKKVYSMKNKLKVYRAIKNINQEDLATALNVSRQTISAIEKEKFSPSLELAFKLARYFDVKIEEIFIYEEKQSCIENLTKDSP